MTIGFAGPEGHIRARSLESLAAIVDQNGNVQGWLGLDDRAMFWVESRPGKKLQELMNLQPSGPNLFSFAGSEARLPSTYKLLSCQSLDAREK